MVVRVRSVDSDLQFGLYGPNLKFLVPHAQHSRHSDAQVEIEAAFADLSGDGRPRGRAVFQCPPLWTLYQDESTQTFSFESQSIGPITYKTACFSRDFLKGKVLLHRPYFAGKPGINPLEYPLDELLILHLLSSGRGVEIHGCGVVDRSGEGRLFVGQSGAGKTTVARIMLQDPAVEVLSDDRVAVRKASGAAYQLYGTPWHGDAGLASPGMARLAGIYFLRQGKSNQLKALKEPEAAARLIACSFLPFHDAEGIRFSLGLVDEICRNVPCSELSFLPDASVLDCIRRSVPGA